MGNAPNVVRKQRIQGIPGSQVLGRAIDQRRFELGYRAQADLNRELGWDKSKTSSIIQGRKGLSGADVRLLMAVLDVPEEWFHESVETRTKEAPEARGSEIEDLRAQALAEYIHHFGHYLATKALKEPTILDFDGPATQAAKATLAEWGRLPAAPSPEAGRLDQAAVEALSDLDGQGEEADPRSAQASGRSRGAARRRRRTPPS